MTNRFSSLISLLNLTAKQGKTTCEFPADTLGINTLRLLRDRGFIWGFHFVSPKKRQARLFPRVKIFLKFIDSKMPILKAIRVFKKTRSNYTVIQGKFNHRFQNQNKYLLLTNPNGLFIMSHADFINMKQRSLNKNHSAKLLAEVFI